MSYEAQIQRNDGRGVRGAKQRKAGGFAEPPGPPPRKNGGRRVVHTNFSPQGKKKGRTGGRTIFYLTIPEDGIIPEGKNDRLFDPPLQFVSCPKDELLSQGSVAC